MDNLETKYEANFDLMPCIMGNVSPISNIVQTYCLMPLTNSEYKPMFFHTHFARRCDERTHIVLLRCGSTTH